MYGQMTAGSWIYIGSQGIVQGTFETFAAAAARHFGGRPRRAARRDGRPRRHGGRAAPRRDDERRDGPDRGGGPGRESSAACERRYLDDAGRSLDAAIDRALEARRRRQAISIGVRANAVDLLERLIARGVVPDLVTDQTSAHDELERLRPARGSETLKTSALLRDATRSATSRGPTRRWPPTCARCWSSSAAGAVVFDYGNNLRGQAKKAGVEDAFDIGGFVPLYIRPLFCEGKGPFRWAALSGDPADIRDDRPGAARALPGERALCAVAPPRAGARRVPGPAGADLLAGLRRTGAGGAPLQRPRAGRQGPRSDRDRPRPPGRRLRRLAQPRDRGDAGRLRRDRGLADPERAAQHGLRSELGLGPSRRRRRHRLLDSRGNGRRGRRHRRGRAAPRAGPDGRSRHRA